MAITEQQAWQMPLADVATAMKAGDGIVPVTDKPAEVQELEKSFADFIAAAPDFQKSPENVETLMSHIAWTRVPTVDDLTQAHALASYRKEYKAPEVQPETDPYKVPMEQLRDAVFGAPQGDPAYSMDMNQLRKEAGLES
jgi:hypothetical protein